LQHLAEERCVGKLPVHELAHVAEAHVAAPQLGAREDAPTTLAHGVVPLEGEVDLIDAVSLRGGAEGRLRARRAAAEENAVLAPHARSSPGTFSPIARLWSNRCATRSSAPPRRPRPAWRAPHLVGRARRVRSPDWRALPVVVGRPAGFAHLPEGELGGQV